MIMSLDQLPFNVFDLVVLAVLVVGLFRGRKQGMSEEFMGLVQWLAIVVCCSFLYRPFGQFLSESSRVFSLLNCYIIAYVVLALLFIAAFALLKRGIGGKLLGSDIFGGAEYYLGMGSGLIRFSCILVAGLALLNARAYDVNEVRAMDNFQNREFGSTFFPTLPAVQATVFQKSLVGPWIHQNLGFLLIEPTKPQVKELHQKEYTFH
jgi:uncharacterized membrane protein required for colicin V production